MSFAVQSCFKDINRLKLPFPLTFQLHNDKAKTAATIPDKKGLLPPGLPEQFAGVLEFSAPEGQAYVPSWMLGNLKLREGGQVRLTTIREVQNLGCILYLVVVHALIMWCCRYLLGNT
jgi:hypothetical protein